MAEKIKLDRKVADAIEDVIESFGSKEKVMDTHVRFRSNWRGKALPLRSFSIEDMAIALYAGYTVKMTPEEMIQAEFQDALRDSLSGDYDRMYTGQARVDAIQFVLETLGVEIKGVTKC